MAFHIKSENPNDSESTLSYYVSSDSSGLGNWSGNSSDKASFSSESDANSIVSGINSKIAELCSTTNASNVKISVFEE